MENYPFFLNFMKRYFPTFIAAIFVAKISCLLALFALLDSFFVNAPLADEAKFFAVCTVICTGVLVHSNFMVIRLAICRTFCGLSVVPTIGYRPNRFVYAAGILFPLLGLLLLNSKRHREIRTQLVEIRRQRELISQASNASCRRR